jgi:hypothetical protein
MKLCIGVFVGYLYNNGTSFPDVFVDESFQYGKTNDANGLALAEGLMGWAACMSGREPPKNFGVGMLKIGSLLNVSATHTELMAFSKIHMKNGEYV